MNSWEKACQVIENADKIEELIQLRLERPEETRESALKWALEMFERYKENE